MDSAPPGLSGEGVGAARKRAKKANFSIALIASRGVLTGDASEANAVIRNFNHLRENQKQDVLNFLRSL